MEPKQKLFTAKKFYFKNLTIFTRIL